MDPRTRPEPFSHWILFWSLALLGLGAALPCLLVPPIEALRRLAEAESRHLQRMEMLEDAMAHQRSFSTALRNDPLINGRVALRDLRYTHLGRVEVVHMQPRSQARRLTVPPLPPPAVPPWIERLYPQRWAAVYRTSLNRHVILLMSLGVLVFAVCAYGPVTRRVR